MNDREQIFADIRKALEPLPKRTPVPEWGDELLLSRYVREELDDLSLFRQQLEKAHGKLFTEWHELATFLGENDARMGYVEASLAADAGRHLSHVRFETTFDRERIDEFQFGLTPASGAIAESGTLILRDRDSRYRLGALAPWIHIAVLNRSHLVRTFGEGIATLDSDPSIVFATGPSKTADIEGILIEGVHGPGLQAVLVV